MSIYGNNCLITSVLLPQARNGNWVTLRAGYGMNGMMLQCRDLPGTVNPNPNRTVKHP